VDQKNDPTRREPAQAEPPRAAEAPPAPRKRFCIEKIEERIAPKKGGNGHHHSQGSIDSIDTTSSSSGSY
jgi:hypothetical protein